MIDKRLIDYSDGYRDYRDKLREDGRELTLPDMLLILEGFLFRYGGVQKVGEIEEADSGKNSNDMEVDSDLILHLCQVLRLGGVYYLQP